jgi:hypothetical protein
MKPMYILRGSSYRGPHRDANGILAQTGKPDGMMISPDNQFTNNKASAKLFDTPDDAIAYYTNVLMPIWTNPWDHRHMIFVVEVEVKQVVSKVTKTATLIK